MTFLSVAVLTGPGSTKGGLETAHDAKSDIRIEYSDWDKILKSVVWDIGPSDRRPSGRYQTGLTKIVRGNPNPSRAESNRVFFHEFRPSHIKALRALRDQLASTPGEVPLRYWSKTEQLAFFLNLHNVAVMTEVADRYPVKTLKTLMRDKDGIWYQPIMTIEGRPTSIRDIEDHIVHNWDDPRVLYGLYLGAVGGPNILRTAFTRDNLWELTDENAREFVNSLRGMRFEGDKARLSILYDLGAPLFDSDADLQDHLTRYTNPYVTGRLLSARRSRIDLYDWYIADLYEGTVAVGATASGDQVGALGLFVEGANGQPIFNNILANSRGLARSKYPPNALDLIKKIYAKHERRGYEGKVGIEELGNRNDAYREGVDEAAKEGGDQQPYVR